MSHPDGPILVLGIGNVLLRDEGVGVQVVHTLESLAERGDAELPPGTSLLDGGTLGLGLLPLLSDARAVLVVDAVDLGRAPGAVEVIRGHTLRRGQAGHASPHRVGVGDLLAAAQLMGTLPEAVALVGVQPSEIAIGLELTELVRAALPIAVETTLGELWRLEALAPSPRPSSTARGHEAAEATA
jgi:hydrogenase maturation protease